MLFISIRFLFQFNAVAFFDFDINCFQETFIKFLSLRVFFTFLSDVLVSLMTGLVCC